VKVLLISVILVLLSACGDNKKTGKEEAAATDSTALAKEETRVAEPEEKSITGTWKPVEMNLRDMDEENKKETMANVRIEFTAEGKFFGYNKDKKQEGTYTWDEKENQLTVVNTARGDKPEKFRIAWEDDLLLMTNEEGTVKLKKQ